MQLKIGTFTSPTATGNQAVSGIGFQPDLVIFMSHENTSEARVGSIRYFFGAAKSSTEQWVNTIFSPDGAAAAANKHYASANYCIHALDGSANVGYRAAMVSMDADGFTVNWDDVATSGRLVGYCAIKGGGQLQLKLGSFDINSTTGNQAVTGVGFSPAALLFCLTLANTTTETISADSTFCMGFATSSADRVCAACGGNDAADPTQEDTYQITDRCLLRMEPGNVPAVNNLLDFVSMDADGFTVNIGTASGTPRAYYLAIGGCSAKASFFDLNTTTGNQSKTGIGFQPELNLFASDCKPDHTTNSNPTCKHMIGVGVSSTQRMVLDGCAHDGFSTTSADTFFKTSQCIESPDAFNNNNDCQADFVSNDSDGFTINNGLVDVDSRRILILSIKEDAAPAGGHPMYSRRKDQKFLRQSPALLAA